MTILCKTEGCNQNVSIKQNPLGFCNICCLKNVDTQLVPKFVAATNIEQFSEALVDLNLYMYDNRLNSEKVVDRVFGNNVDLRKKLKSLYDKDLVTRLGNDRFQKRRRKDHSSHGSE